MGAIGHEVQREEPKLLLQGIVGVERGDVHFATNEIHLRGSFNVVARDDDRKYGRSFEGNDLSTACWCEQRRPTDPRYFAVGERPNEGLK